LPSSNTRDEQLRLPKTSHTLSKQLDDAYIQTSTQGIRPQRAIVAKPQHTLTRQLRLFTTSKDPQRRTPRASRRLKRQKPGHHRAKRSDKEPPQHGRTRKLEVFWAAPSRRRNNVEKPSPPAWYKPSKVSSEDLAEQCRSPAPRRKLKGQPRRCHPAKPPRDVTFCRPPTHQPTSPNPQSPNAGRAPARDPKKAEARVPAWGERSKDGTLNRVGVAPAGPKPSPLPTQSPPAASATRPCPLARCRQDADEALVSPAALAKGRRLSHVAATSWNPAKNRTDATKPKQKSPRRHLPWGGADIRRRPPVTARWAGVEGGDGGG
jgi:hypothetical protein